MFKFLSETCLSYGEEAAKVNLRSGLKAQDEPGKHDTFNNNQVKKRAKWIEGSKTFQGYTFLAADHMALDKLMPSTYKISIKLNRSKDEFVLHHAATITDKLKIEISEIKVYIRYIEVIEKIRQDHLKLHGSDVQKFPIVRSEIKVFSESGTSPNVNLHNIYKDDLPKSILVLLVNTQRFSGHLQRNPYLFHHYNITHACLKYNSETIPSDPFTPDISNKRYWREYRSIIDSIGLLHDNASHLVTPELYENGFFALAFSTSPDNCYHAHTHEAQTGSVDLQLKFKEAPGEAFTIILFATYDVMLTFDSRGEHKALYL